MKQHNQRSFFRYFWQGTLALCFFIFVGIIFFLGILSAGLPDADALKDMRLQEPLRVYTKDGQLIGEFGEIHRYPVTLKEIPKPIIDATLATEDQRFYSHPGVDVLGLLRAALVLVTTGEKQEGGSTITMQVARNFFLTPQKTFTRKIREILLSFKMEQMFSKDKILELYLNKVFYGNRSYGIAAAAKTYFGKSLYQLTLAEIAQLVGIPKAPSTLNPLSHPQRAQERRNHVLSRMLELHLIDQNAYQTAIATPVTARYHDVKAKVEAPYVAEMVRQTMFAQLGEKAYTDGFNVYTTIDSHQQMMANWSMRKALINYDRRHGYHGPEKSIGTVSMDRLSQALKILKAIPSVGGLEPAFVLTVNDQSADILLKDGSVDQLDWDGMKWARKQTIRNNQEYIGEFPVNAQAILKSGDLIRLYRNPKNQWVLSEIPAVEGAFVVLDPQDGAIRALSGGFDYRQNNFNHVIQAKRLAGSSFKPFLYSAALEKGFTLASLINDAPIVTKNQNSVDSVWRPQNTTGIFYGPTRLREALAKSRNLVSIRLLQDIGIPDAVDYISRFGFTADQLPHDLSLALGTASVTPLEMVRGYAVFANGGYLINPYLIERTTNPEDKTLYQSNPLVVVKDAPAEPSTQQKLAPQVISPANDYLMTSALQDVIQSGTGRAASILNRHDLAGKTGTTNDTKDAWFCGFHPALVAVTWIGFDDARSLYEYGAQAALPAWIDFMKLALKNQPEKILEVPSDIETVRINKNTGLPTTSSDPDAMFEVFKSDTH